MSDPLVLQQLLAAIASRRGKEESRAGIVGRRVELHRTLDSTNDRARELAASGEPEGTVVMAEEQTRGRGRATRSWHSAPGLGLYMTSILRPAASPTQAPMFGLLAAVAVAVSLARISSASVLIKWPNDLMVEDARRKRRKLAGILTEARTGPDLLRDLVIGIGVNVNHGPDDFPSEIAERATSLRMLRGHLVDRIEVAAEILTALDDWYTLWGREGEAPVLDAFRSLSPDIVGQRVSVGSGLETWVGTTAGLTGEGALRVLPDGSRRAVEVRFGEVMRVEEI